MSFYNELMPTESGWTNSPVAIITPPPDESAVIYVAGPMSGKKLLNFPEFFALSMRLRDAGWKVENPAEHDMANGIDPTQEVPAAKVRDFLRKDIRILVDICTDVIFLPGWESSKGATLEHHVASSIGLRMWQWTGMRMEPIS